VELVIDAALVEPDSRLLHRVAILDAINRRRHVSSPPNLIVFVTSRLRKSRVTLAPKARWREVDETLGDQKPVHEHALARSGAGFCGRPNSGEAQLIRRHSHAGHQNIE
jgi:hypothetical protein